MQPRIAILYEHSAYIETVQPTAAPAAGSPRGLMGRQVAGKEFLDAYLTFGNWDELVALVPNKTVGRGLVETCKTHPSSRARQRRLKLVEFRDFQERFHGTSPAANILHLPCPPDGRFAWARRQGGHHDYAVCGVTHTLSSLASVGALRRLVTAPYASYDRLICTSRAVREMVLAVTGAYADHLGLGNRLRIGLETMPLGVNTEKFRPPRSDERIAARNKLGADDDEIVVLFVGRLSHHAKAHPFPMFRSVAEAASRTGRKLHLVLAGWASSAAVTDAFRDGAARFAPGVRTSIVDGTDPDLRYSVWRAGDIFTSLSDNIQETFGLVVLEAMACGLPVVASDWNGYRDLVLDGTTGCLIPTAMVRGATSEATVRLITGAANYDHFLAECNQAVTVDCRSAARALASLVEDADLRLRMGKAGRERVQRQFDWRHVVEAYERLWREQDLERRAVIKIDKSSPTVFAAPAVYPPPERSFATYPSDWLDDEQQVRAVDGAAARVEELANLPLTNYETDRRCNDIKLLQKVLRAAATGRRLAELDTVFRDAGVDHMKGRATAAWLLKYDLLRWESPRLRNEEQGGGGAEGTAAPPQLCFVTTCMGRLAFLKQSLPRMAKQPNCSCVVVDYSCPENCGDWVEANFPEVRVVRCPGHKTFHRSAAKNAGAFAARTPWICLIDGDILLAPDFSARVLPMLREGECYRASVLGEGTGGTIICRREDFENVGGHDLNFQGWGEEDDDVRDALKFSGLEENSYPVSLIEHVDHDDEMRLQYHDATDRRKSHMVNRIYRAVKWDMARLERKPLSDRRRSELYRSMSEQVAAAIQSTGTVELSFEMGAMTWAPVELSCRRRLTYELTAHRD